MKSSTSSSLSQSVSSQPPSETQDLPGPSSSSSIAAQQAQSPSGSSTHSGTSRCASVGLPEDAELRSSASSPPVFSPPGSLQPLSISSTSPDINPYESDPGARSSSDSSVDDILREVMGSKISHDEPPRGIDGDICGGSAPFLFTSNGSPCSNTYSHDSVLSPQSNWSDNSSSNQQSTGLFPAESFSSLGGIDSRTHSASTSGWNSAVASPQNGSLPFNVLDDVTYDFPASLLSLSDDVTDSTLHYGPPGQGRPTITLSVNCGSAGVGAMHSDLYLGQGLQLPIYKEGSQWLY